MSNDQPPLPLTKSQYGFDDTPAFTADQMREYGRACERAAYERAAQVCDAWQRMYDNDSAPESYYNDGQYDAAQTIGNRIRALGADK